MTTSLLMLDVTLKGPTMASCGKPNLWGNSNGGKDKLRVSHHQPTGDQMRLITHAMLKCNVKGVAPDEGYPLIIQSEKMETIPQDFNPGKVSFIVSIVCIVCIVCIVYIACIVCIACIARIVCIVQFSTMKTITSLPFHIN